MEIKPKTKRRQTSSHELTFTFTSSAIAISKAMSQVSTSLSTAATRTETTIATATIVSCGSNEELQRKNNEYPSIAPGPGKQDGQTAGIKRTLTNQQESLDLSEKKLRRLEKNRLSARACRRRKREAAQEMEREIHMLESENLQLRLQLQIGEEGEGIHNKEKEHLTESLDKLIQTGAPDSEIKSTMEEFKEKFSDYGRTRRSAIDFHLRNIARLLMPTTTTSVAMVALKGESFLSKADKKDNQDEPASSQTSNSETLTTAAPNHNSEASIDTSCTDGDGNSTNKFDPKALFQHFVQYLDVTPEQAAALKDSRLVAKELDQTLRKSLSILQELRQRLTQCGKELETEFDSVEQILTPTQTAKFLVWISNNRACMHMLNELWSKTYDNGVVTKRDESSES